jgi:hypothetical protein
VLSCFFIIPASSFVHQLTINYVHDSMFSANESLYYILSHQHISFEAIESSLLADKGHYERKLRLMALVIDLSYTFIFYLLVHVLTKITRTSLIWTFCVNLLQAMLLWGSLVAAATTKRFFSTQLFPPAVLQVSMLSHMASPPSLLWKHQPLTSPTVVSSWTWKVRRPLSLHPGSFPSLLPRLV